MRVEIQPGLFAEVSSADELKDLYKVREANPLWGYFPNPPKQVDFHKATASGGALTTIAFFGGNRSGKTHCSVADDLIQILPDEFIPPHLLPYKRFHGHFNMWIAVPKYPKLEEVIFPKIRALCPRAALSGGGFDKAYSKTDKVLTFADGNTIGFKTFDQDVDAYSGAELQRIHWDEEPEGEHGRAIRKEARMRLISTGGDEVISMTPLFGYSWVYEEVEQKAHLDPNIRLIRADMDDNPHLDPIAKAAAIKDLTAEELLARKGGEFIHFKGKVYAEFNDHDHVLQAAPPIDHVRGLDTICIIDPGIRTTAILFMGFDSDNHALVYDELYLHDEEAIPENAAALARAKCKAWGVVPMAWVIDPSARNRNIVTGTDVQEAYGLAGIPTLPGKEKVEAGVFEVKRRLQHSPPMLTVSPTCKVFRWEMSIYRMDDKEDGKFAVVKENDHIMDTLRYGCMARPLAPSGPDPEVPKERYEYGRAPSFNWQFDQTPTGVFDPL